MVGWSGVVRCQKTGGVALFFSPREAMVFGEEALIVGRREGRFEG